ncbi:MAG: CatB-related O-acetyltransferase [Aliishimia sp.]
MTDPRRHRFPDPLDRCPARAPDGTPIEGTVFLSQVIDQDNFDVGAFTYASDFEAPQDWRARLAPYLFPGALDRLVIGKFCQIAHGVRFITAGANHAMDGVTTYPFPIFDPTEISSYQPDTRDTVIGHDVWLGMGALICPGAIVGNGVIIGAGAVVRGRIPDYAIVTGNPAQVVRFRFDAETVETLLQLAWWDWPIERIARARSALLSANIEVLKTLAP